MHVNKAALAVVTIASFVLSCGHPEDDPSEPVITWYARAERAYAEGDLDSARSGVETVLDQSPSFQPALLLAGKIAFLEERHERSLDYFDELIGLNPSHVDGRKWLARLHRIRNDLAAAESVLLPALQISTEDPELLIELARIYRDKDDLSGALEYYGKALVFSDRLAVAALELAEIYNVYGIEARAARTLERALSLADVDGSIRPAIENRIEAIGASDEE